MPPTSLTLTPPDAEWMQQARCAGYWALMESDSPKDEDDAKALCHACPVEGSCARWTLSLSPREDVYGVAGGMTADERASARRRIRRTKPSAPAETKRCPHCREDKPLGQFYVRPERPSGRDVYCRPCCADLARARRAAKKAAAT